MSHRLRVNSSSSSGAPLLLWPLPLSLLCAGNFIETYAPAMQISIRHIGSFARDPAEFRSNCERHFQATAKQIDR